MLARKQCLIAILNKVNYLLVNSPDMYTCMYMYDSSNSMYGGQKMALAEFWN